jgi:glycosyltransferase involved in cell wall biosynthesis
MNEVLDGLGRKYPQVRMDVICDTFFDCENLTIEKRMWNPVTEIEDLRRLDIGLMPLVDDPWSRGKCGLKLLQYYGVGVPAVCTPVGVNRDIVKDGVNGFTALTPEEWSEKLSVLIENPELRKTMGLRGRDLVMESFTLQANAPRFYRVLEEVLARSLAA